MKIAIYSRKSKFTGRGESIDNQIKKCKEFIKFKFEVDPEENSELFIDEDYTGRNENRPRFKEMISQIKNNQIQAIVVYQLNRFGRNARDIHNRIAMCDEHNCVLHSATEGFNTGTSFGRAIMGILASLAQLETEQLGERVKDNMYNLARMGRWLGGQSPLGFDGTREFYIDENGKERSVTKLKRNDEELKIVKAIYKKYLEEKSLSQVSKWSLTNNFKGKNGGNIDKSAVNAILKNPVYVKSNDIVFRYLENEGFEVCGEANGKGMLRYGQEGKNSKNTDSNKQSCKIIIATASHKGIIDPNDWLAVQNILKTNTEKAPALGKSKSALLTGLLKCSCGSNMQMRYGPKRKDGTKKHYYICNMKINSGGTRCNSKNIDGPLIEEQLIKYLKSYNSNILIKELRDLIKNDKINSNNTNLVSIEVDIKECQESVSNLYINLKKTTNDKVVQGIFFEIENLQSKIEALNSKKEDMLNSQCDKDMAESEIIRMVSLLEEFNTVYDDLPHEDKKKYLNRLLKSIELDLNNKVHLKFNVKKN
ncbi:UNVERIFIED_ORG: recombinase family protein [Clostridium botulinum]